MKTWRLGLLLGLASLLAVGCATGGLAPDPKRRLDLPGFSILPPQGENWRIAPAAAYRIIPLTGAVVTHRYEPIWTKTETNPLEQFAVGEISFDKGTAGGTPKGHLSIKAYARTLDASDLKEASVAELQRKSETGWGVVVRSLEHFRLLNAKASPDPSLGPNCVRFEQVDEARDVPGAPWPVFLGTTRGIRCLHPHWPRYAIGLLVPPAAPSRGAAPPDRGGGRALSPKPPVHDGPPVSRPENPGRQESPRHALGEGSVWVTNSGDNTVTRIDRGTNQATATIAVGKAPFGVAGGDNAIWVANRDDRTVSRIDPRTNQVLATIPVGREPHRVVARPGEVWVANQGSNTVSRIDPKTNQVVATIAVGQEPNGLAIAEGAVWVANSKDRTVSRIDPATNRLVGEPIRLTAFPTGIAAGEGAVWLAANVFVSGPLAHSQLPHALVRIDPKTNTWDTPATGIAGAVGVAAGGGAVWVTSVDLQSVLRVDPQTKRVVAKPILVGGQALDVAVGEGALWVTDTSGNAISRVDLP